MLTKPWITHRTLQGGSWSRVSNQLKAEILILLENAKAMIYFWPNLSTYFFPKYWDFETNIRVVQNTSLLAIFPCPNKASLTPFEAFWGHLGFVESWNWIAQRCKKAIFFFLVSINYFPRSTSEFLYCMSGSLEAKSSSLFFLLGEWHSEWVWPPYAVNWQPESTVLPQAPGQELFEHLLQMVCDYFTFSFLLCTRTYTLYLIWGIFSFL